MTPESETRDGTGRGRLHRWLLVLGVWSGVALFSVAQIWVARRALGHPPPLGPLFALELPVWGFWALGTGSGSTSGRR